MPVLAKISPDYLRDTIVELRYTAKLPYDILKGLIYQELKESFQLLSNINPLGIFQIGPQQQIKFGGSDVLDFSDDDIKIQVREGRIVFNTLNAYPGWKSYFPKIQLVLNKLHDAGYLNQFQRVGIRYINEFPDILIFNHIRVNLHFAFTDVTSYNTTIKTELDENGVRVILNLGNNVRRQAPNQDAFFSIIDIDVIGDVPNDATLTSLYAQIDHLHRIEKDFFLSILMPEFLNQLNPEFEQL